MAFSIRDTIPEHANKKDSELDNPANLTTRGRRGMSAMYHQTDLMVHLCMGWKYELLYGPLKPTIVHMQGRLNDLPKHLEPVKILAKKNGVAAHLTEIMRLLNSTQEVVTLRDFFVVKHAKNTVRGSIAAEFMKLEKLLGDYVCLPFCRFQEAKGDAPVDPSVMNTHIDQIGKYDMLDFYTRPKKYYPELAAAIKYGRDEGILSRPPGKSRSGLAGVDRGTGGGGGTNNRTCNSNGKCQASTGGFCTEDPATKLCSAASG